MHHPLEYSVTKDFTFTFTINYPCILSVVNGMQFIH